MDSVRVAVIGAGQAGLCASHYLGQAGVEHAVLERSEVGSSWRSGRWDSFRLVTPTWQCRLPGPPCTATASDGFMTHRQVAAQLEQFARWLKPPLRTEVDVREVTVDAAGGFILRTASSGLRASSVIVACGTFQRPRLPRLANALDQPLMQLHSSAYRNPEALPPGAVLVVGSGQSGWQIARELHRAGRRVHWSLGRTSRLPRQYRGRDIFRWLDDLLLLDLPIDEHPGGPSVRTEPKPFICEQAPDGPEDPRRLALEGLVVHGRLAAVEGSRVRFQPGARLALQEADESCRGVTDLIDTFVELEGLSVPAATPLVTPFEPTERSPELDLRSEGVSTVIWASGYRADWSWLPSARCDDSGHPLQQRGEATQAALYFVGLDWMHTWGSGLLHGVAADAEHVVQRIVAR